MKRILVPTDFSECANWASEMAIRLAGKSGAEILYLHLAMEDEVLHHNPGAPTNLVSHEVSQSRYKLDRLVASAESAGVAAKSELVVGNGQERIEDYIKPFQIDWLVMGSHGASGFKAAIIGSHTQHVIRNISIPSLVVKQKPSLAIPANLVFASTFNEDSFNPLKEVANFCKLLHSKLHLLFVNMTSHLIDEKVARLMMTHQMDSIRDVSHTLNITETNDKEFGITEFATEVKADIIAVAMEKKTMLGRLMSPVLAEQLINRSTLPVLVISPGNKF